jgi:hypothetical protein
MCPDECCCNPATGLGMRATGQGSVSELNEIASCRLLGSAILFGQNGRFLACCPPDVATLCVDRPFAVIVT